MIAAPTHRNKSRMVPDIEPLHLDWPRTMLADPVRDFFAIIIVHNYIPKNLCKRLRFQFEAIITE